MFGPRDYVKLVADFPFYVTIQNTLTPSKHL
jgi:hypothetical protein